MLSDHPAEHDRRGRPERRRRAWWSLLYGSFNPRRRAPPRRRIESRFHSLDWHAAHLLAVTLGILILSVADALMTVRLVSGGADELNPFMAAAIGSSTAVFVGVKMTLTGIGVTIMVVLARYRFMRVVRVDLVLYALLVGYVVLLAYEISLFHTLADAFEL